jgi:hypothetical protein
VAASVVLTLGGIALFLAGHAFFKWAVFGALPWSRAVAIAALAGLMPLGFALPTLALSSAAVLMDHKGRSYYPFAVYTYGRVEIQFQHMRRRPFDDEAKRLELLRRLNEIEGVDISVNKLTKRPSIPLSALRSTAALKQYLQAFDWYVQEVRAL